MRFKEDQAYHAESRCYIVLHQPSNTPCFLLTWTNIQKIGWDDPYDTGQSSRTLRIPSIYRLHANSTSMSCHMLEAVSYDPTFGEVKYTISGEDATRSETRFWQYGDVDLLEPAGFHVIISHVSKARRNLDMSWMTIQDTLRRTRPVISENVLSPHLSPFVRKHDHKRAKAAAPCAILPKMNIVSNAPSHYVLFCFDLVF